MHSLKFKSVVTTTRLTRAPRTCCVRAVPPEQVARIIGDGIGAFVFFYTSLEWLRYRKIREAVEDAQEKDAERKERLRKFAPKRPEPKNNPDTE